MKKTLILVVDRDDDFGAKAGITSPVIGFKACTEAATALGIADPEDSDTNALFAALNIYKEMENEREAGTFEVALICGNQKVGFRSDEELVRQIEVVLDKVKPSSSILVGDGAEDEYIYPIITSRVPVDSVRKVYVKQAPGVEGTLYLLKKIMDDPQKKERFMAPMSWVLILISAIYLISGYISKDTMKDYVTSSTTAFIVFAIGILLMFYAYSMEERITESYRTWKSRARQGSIMTVFTAMSFLLVVVGVFVAYYSYGEIYTDRDTQIILVFAIHLLWFLLFAAMVYTFGIILDGYIKSRTIKYTYITFILNVVSVGLVVTGLLDYLMDYVGMYSMNFTECAVEIVGGFLLAIVASMLQIKIKKVYLKTVSPDSESAENEVQ